MSKQNPQIRVSQQDLGSEGSQRPGSQLSAPDKSVNLSEESKNPAEQKNYTLAPEIEAQLKEAFAVFDVSGDGQIDANELLMILKAVNKDKEVTLEEVEEMIAAVDDGGDGEI